MKNSKKEILWLFFMSLSLSVLMFYSYFSDEEEKEIINKTGIYSNYRYFKNTKGKDFYFITLNNENYSIPEIYISAFDSKRFSENINKGDTITLQIEVLKLFFKFLRKIYPL
ncbi:hypothetical protein [Mesoflavibacter sp. CH_XMU1404-2]|uniref:hypothetical protein n=1 Tax=Mesoflavibacter sp. CH_XMU1404-2 TaxID=3107766 RepID=UPI00300BD6CA